MRDQRDGALSGRNVCTAGSELTVERQATGAGILCEDGAGVNGGQCHRGVGIGVQRYVTQRRRAADGGSKAYRAARAGEIIRTIERACKTQRASAGVYSGVGAENNGVIKGDSAIVRGDISTDHS